MQNLSMHVIVVCSLQKCGIRSNNYYSCSVCACVCVENAAYIRTCVCANMACGCELSQTLVRALYDSVTGINEVVAVRV